MDSQTIMAIVAVVAGIIGLALLLNAGDSIIKFLSNYFVTTAKYNEEKEKEKESITKARSDCRNAIYEEIKKKANDSDVKRLDDKVDNLTNQLIQISQVLASLSAKVDMLLGLKGVKIDE